MPELSPAHGLFSLKGRTARRRDLVDAQALRLREAGHDAYLNGLVLPVDGSKHLRGI